MLEQGLIMPTINDLTGGLVVSQTYGYTNEDSKWKKILLKATAGQTTFYDIKLNTEIKLQGGSYYIINPEAIGFNPETLQRDYIEFSIIDKDDVLGLFERYNLSKENGDILEIKKFVQNGYVIPQEEFIDKYSAFSVKSGLYFRIAYNSIGTQDVYFIVKLYILE